MSVHVKILRYIKSHFESSQESSVFEGEGGGDSNYFNKYEDM